MGSYADLTLLLIISLEAILIDSWRKSKLSFLIRIKATSWLVIKSGYFSLNFKLKYPKHLVDSTVKTLLNLRVADQSLLRSKSTTENTTRVVIPFKDQESANIVKTQLKDLSVKLQTIVQPVFTSCKIAQEFPTSEPTPQLIDQQCVVYNFKCDHCDAGYVGYTRGHLFVRVDGHRSKTLSVPKHYDNRHPGRIPDGHLHSSFNVLKKCQNKFDCLVNEMLLIKQLRQCLNVQSDSIRAKVFV